MCDKCKKISDQFEIVQEFEKILEIFIEICLPEDGGLNENLRFMKVFLGSTSERSR